MVAAGRAASSAASLLEPALGKELEDEGRVAAIRPVLEERVGAALEGRQPLLPAAVRARRNCAEHADFGAGGAFLKCADAETKRRQRRGRRAAARRLGSSEDNSNATGVNVTDTDSARPLAGVGNGSLHTDTVAEGQRSARLQAADARDAGQRRPEHAVRKAEHDRDNPKASPAASQKHSGERVAGPPRKVQDQQSGQWIARRSIGYDRPYPGERHVACKRSAAMNMNTPSEQATRLASTRRLQRRHPHRQRAQGNLNLRNADG